MTELGKFTHVDLLFPSKYLKAADLRGKDLVIRIVGLDPRHELKSKTGSEFKPVLEFKADPRLELDGKKLVLNKTNALSIAAVYGGEIKGWFGKLVALYPTKVSGFGKTHDAIRVREEIPQERAKPAEEKQSNEAQQRMDEMPGWDEDQRQAAAGVG